MQTEVCGYERALLSSGAGLARKELPKKSEECSLGAYVVPQVALTNGTPRFGRLGGHLCPPINRDH